MAVFTAHADYVDLTEGNVIGQSKCIHEAKQFVCVAVEMNQQVYVVLLDRKGEYAIYLVGEKESTLIWFRDTV